MSAAIEWQSGDLGAAFALAESVGRPLFLYWGAGWCPPCNRVKADLFGRAGFAQRMRGLLAFHLDGDSPGAQALAARYKLRSYPTLVLFRPDGREITRLPCELDGELFLDALDGALHARHTAAESLQALLDGARPLDAAEWSLLSLYSWDTDEGQLLGARDLAATLRQLAQACPQQEAAARLELHAQLASAGRATTERTAGRLLELIGNANLARANMDLLGNSGVQLIRWAGARQPELADALNRAARAWAGDTWLSVADRLTAVRLQMRLARLGAPAQGLSELVQDVVTAALAEADGPYERHTVLNTALSTLNDAGLGAQAEALLQAELARSHSPYYFMHSLASAARRRGDTAGVLDWQQRAWQAAVGPATRLQWGTSYLLSLIELSPQDTARIEQAADGMARAVGATADAFQQRNRVQLQRLAAGLATLSAPGAHSAALREALTAIA